MHETVTPPPEKKKGRKKKVRVDGRKEIREERYRVGRGR